jgi:DNA mismatch repair protein MutS2
MIYPHNFEQKIEFDAIRTMVSDHCISAMGKEHAGQIQFQDDLEIIERQIDETIEFCGILATGSGFPAQDYFDLREELKRIRVEGAFITQEMMFDLRSSLMTMTAIVKFIKSYKETDIPSIRNIMEGIQIEPWILKKLEGIIDDRGMIRDNASVDLADLRKKIAQKENALNRKIAQNLKIAKQQGWVARDAEVALRDGRQVIPVSASHKRQIQGLIVDESATGQTVYIEPTEALAISNEMRELKGAEKREIIRILKHFTDDIRPELPALLQNYEVLGKIDFVRSKARLALQINGNKPKLNHSPELDWQEAIHPLLYISHMKQKKNVVPLSIKLSRENRILVISGPNAGGKSVCLKTVGLLQYMVQCGFPIPVGDGSTSGVFKNLFIDIGDEQSLENDLSTYSSHLLNMKNLVINGDAETLFLIDEFGTGTEPRLGGAIAETTLEKLNEKKCFGVVTTHYSNLKLLAKKGNGIINGAMLFDAKKMEPLYQLSMGKPGSSFAFEIARKIGFPEELLDNAEIKTGKKQLDFDEQLQQLDLEKRELDKKKQEFSVADSFLSELIEKYENLKNDLESKKRKIIEDAQEEAFSLLQSSNRMIEQTIREIREAQADKKKTMELRKALWVEKEKIKKARKTKTPAKKEKEAKHGLKKAKPADTKIRTGDTVRIPGQDIKGEVLSISGDEVVLGFNSISFRTQLDKVEKIPVKENQKQTSKRKSEGYSGIADRLNAKMANFSFQLDVRGMRGEEAVEKLRNYIDDASMLNISEVKILHGKGHGILRTLVHDYLRTLPEIKTFRDEHIERGGHGITIVILK